MSQRLMVLPSKDVGRIRLVSVPDDMSAHEAYRSATGLIAEVEPSGESHWIDAVLDQLEDHGFSAVDFDLGPPLD